MKISRLLIGIVSILVIGFAGFCFYLYNNYTTPILMYHSFDKDRVDSYAAVAPQVFAEQMNFIKREGLKVISLEEYCRALNKSGKPVRNAVVLTFDDGYKDNLNILDTLKKFDYPVTIFIIADRIGREGYLTKTDIEYMLSDYRVDIGSHTLSHAYLPDLDLRASANQIEKSKLKLQELFGRPIILFSYPIGGFTGQVLRQVKKSNYLCACTTNRGFSRDLDRFTLRRIKISNRDKGIRLWAKLSGFYNIFKKPKDPY